MTAHDHDDPAVLTIGCGACINLVRPRVPLGPADVDENGLSAGQRLTIRNKQILNGGNHPATLAPLAARNDTTLTCGTCSHHQALRYHNTMYHKCDLHRLGMTHSTASDIRVSWPACIKWEAEVAP
jgi:hypothetical protein